MSDSMLTAKQTWREKPLKLSRKFYPNECDVWSHSIISHLLECLQCVVAMHSKMRSRFTMRQGKIHIRDSV